MGAYHHPHPCVFIVLCGSKRLAEEARLAAIQARIAECEADSVVMQQQERELSDKVRREGARL